MTIQPPNLTPELQTRQLLVDLKSGFGRHWNGGDAFRTAFANALSMSFPVGEQFFIDSVRCGLTQLPTNDQNQSLRELAKGFIRQEATHRRLHGIYNDYLEQNGLRNHWGPRAQRRIQRLRNVRQAMGLDRGYLHDLAITAAYEHYTAIFGDLVLRRQNQTCDLFYQAEPMMLTLWRWHAAEETEHRCVAFDLYHALDGGQPFRVAWYLYVSIEFAVDIVLQTCNNLWRDGTFFKFSTWTSAMRFVAGRQGVAWEMIRPLLAYFRPGFHPLQLGDVQMATDWFRKNAQSWRAVCVNRPCPVDDWD
jgi:predicted metal-dependent hydrolase